MPSTHPKTVRITRRSSQYSFIALNIVLLFVLQLIPTTSANTTSRVAPRITGWLHTQGGQILDEKEQPVRFEGMNLGAPLVNGFGYPLVDDSACTTWWDGYDKIVRHGYDNISRWGFNLVRAQFSWADLEPFPPTINQDGSITHHWNQYYLKAMDNIVSNLTSRGIALIPDIGQFYWSPAFKHPYTSGYCQGGGMPVWLYPNAASLQK